MDAVSLGDGEGHMVEIYLHGATVTSWKHSGREQIFVSSKAVWNGVKAIRGGIPVVFPQFGQPNQAMAQHGFARSSTWRLQKILSEDSKASALFILEASESTLSVWPHNFILEYTVSISRDGLQCSLKATNSGDAPFDCHTLLHTYFAIPHINEVCFSGFNGLSFADKTRNNDTFTDTEELRTIDGECDRVYAHSPSHPVPDVQIRSKSSNAVLMTVSKQAGIEAPDGTVAPVGVDCVLWNPWIEKATALADMDDDGYERFVCVEPGTVSQWVTVQPGNSLVLSQSLVPASA